MFSCTMGPTKRTSKWDCFILCYSLIIILVVTVTYWALNPGAECSNILHIFNKIAWRFWLDDFLSHIHTHSVKEMNSVYINSEQTWKSLDYDI